MRCISFCRDIVSLVATFLIVLVMAYGKDISPVYHLNKAVTDHFIGYFLKHLFLGFVNTCIISRL